MKKGNPYGTHRVIEPKGVLPQPALKIDNTMELYDNEILIDVQTLNIDSASFTQIKEQKGSRTRLKVYKDKMLMTKVGIYSSKMEFQQGKKYTNLYSTPYGSFDLVYNTVLYENKLNEKGRGNIYTEYVITFADSDESYNKLSIDII
jgi:uncharacterized beta-barrel protein YwiB (DUF1934 family)